MSTLTRTHSGGILKFVFGVPGAQKRLFWKSVAFVAFVAFLGTTMLFFEKFKVRAFRKVYGLWGYLQIK